MLKKHIKLEHAGIVDHSMDRKMERENKPTPHHMTAKWQILVPYRNKLHIPPTISKLARDEPYSKWQQPYNKAYLLIKKKVENFLGKS